MIKAEKLRKFRRCAETMDPRSVMRLILRNQRLERGQQFYQSEIEVLKWKWETWRRVAECVATDRDDALAEAHEAEVRLGELQVRLGLMDELKDQSSIVLRQSIERGRKIDALQAECAKWRADVEQAAGELRVDVPEPGTDMARVLIANRLLTRRLEEALADTPHSQH